MKRLTLIPFIVALFWVSTSMAATVTVEATVDSQAGPWNPIINTDYDYGTHDNDAPTVIDEGWGLNFSEGHTLTITYVSGTVKAGIYFPLVDANGDPVTTGEPLLTNDFPGSSGTLFPSKYMPADWDTYLMALVGTFANDSGIIVGTPFEVGNGPVSVSVPSGATRLQLGINDDIFHDNSGSFTVKVEGSPVPIPGAIWLLGAGLAGLFGLRRKKI